MDGIDIERVTQFNFLGLILSSNLKWQCHIDYVARKVSRSIGVINTLKISFPQNILITIYNSLIFSHLNYCLIVWGSNTHSLAILQKKALRIMTFSKFRAHTEPLFKDLSMLKLPDLYIMKILKLCFNLFNNNLPDQFNHLLPRLTDGNTHYPIRNKTYKLPLVKHEFAKSSTGYNIIRIINSTPKEITDKMFTHSLYGFATYGRMHMLNSYNPDCSILDCFICSNNQV